MSPFPRFGTAGGPPFGGLGSLRDQALMAGAHNPGVYPPTTMSVYPTAGGLIVSSAPSDLYGLGRPGFPSLFSSPPTSLGTSTWAPRGQGLPQGLPDPNKKPLGSLPPPGSLPPGSLPPGSMQPGSMPPGSLPPLPGGPLAPPSSIPKIKQQATTPLASPGRNGSVGGLRTNGTGDPHGHRPRDHSRSPMRPPSSASSMGSPLISSHHNVSNPSLDLSLKKDQDNNRSLQGGSQSDHEIQVVGEKVVNNHQHSVPNGNGSRPPSSHNSMGVGLPPGSKSGGIMKNPHVQPTSSTYSDIVAKSLSMVRPPMSSSAMSNPFGLPPGSGLPPGLYPQPHGAAALGAHHPGGHPGANPFALDPFRDPYRAALSNPYLQSRESLIRLNQLMMTEQERIRMGLASYPPGGVATPHSQAAAAAALFAPPHSSAATPSSMQGKPPTIPAPPLGYPPGYHPGLGLPLPSPGQATPTGLNGHNPGGSSSYHAK